MGDLDAGGEVRRLALEVERLEGLLRESERVRDLWFGAYGRVRGERDAMRKLVRGVGGLELGDAGE